MLTRHQEMQMLRRMIECLLAELRPHRHHHHHHRHPALAGFVFFTHKEHHHMAIITTLEIGASGVAHASFVDANGLTGAFAGTPVWSASNADATVTPRADGLTADVTRLTANPFTVTATVQSTVDGSNIVASGDLPLPAVVPIQPAVSGNIGFTDV